ncbi:hypothetical protein [Pseudomonas aeruginosa]|uniref:hypothetical protein n=1 Tax=Pseudomonas aeruginosa TaxID=287 RepID=UPI003D2774A4
MSTHPGITRALHCVRQQYGEEPFVDGDCHTLAVALLEANGLQGSLVACMLDGADAGAAAPAEYLHMVYRCPEGHTWDINGDKAESRWEERMASAGIALGGADATHRLRWEEVPYQDHQVWLMDNYGCVDILLCNKLTQMMKGFMTMHTQAIHHPQADEGWALFEIGHSGLMEIQRDDEMAVFASDDDALDYVKRLAAEGSQRHQEALTRHLADAPALNRDGQA